MKRILSVLSLSLAFFFVGGLSYGQTTSTNQLGGNVGSITPSPTTAPCHRVVIRDEAQWPDNPGYFIPSNSCLAYHDPYAFGGGDLYIAGLSIENPINRPVLVDTIKVMMEADPSQYEKNINFWLQDRPEWLAVFSSENNFLSAGASYSGDVYNDPNVTWKNITPTGIPGLGAGTEIMYVEFSFTPFILPPGASYFLAFHIRNYSPDVVNNLNQYFGITQGNWQAWNPIRDEYKACDSGGPCWYYQYCGMNDTNRVAAHISGCMQ